MTDTRELDSGDEGTAVSTCALDALLSVVYVGTVVSTCAFDARLSVDEVVGMVVSVWALQFPGVSRCAVPVPRDERPVLFEVP